MQAASRETYKEARESLEGIARKADAATLNAIGDELVAVAGLLGREPRLRRALADPGRPGTERQALLDGIVGGKVGKQTQELLGTLTRGRWSSTSELLDAVENLGVDALLAAAAAGGDLGEVEDELFRFGQVVDGSPQLAAALGDVTAAPAQRASLVDSLLSGKSQPATLRLAKIALEGFGGRTFTGSLTRFVELAAEQRNQRVAYVTVASPLDDAAEQRLAEQLAGMYGRGVSLKITIDPSVIGGVRVLIGSDLYDGTTIRRLDDARHALTGE